MEKYFTTNIGRADSARFAPGKITIFLVAFYFVLSVFELYYQNFTGPLTRYYLVFLMIVLLLSYKKVRFGSIQLLIMFWLLFKFLSATWAPFNDSDVFSRHLLSQIGMVGLVIVLSIERYDQESINKLVNVLFYSSVAMGILTMFFAKPFIGEDARMAVDLFGIQEDPNNLAAIYLVGITIALYYILFERKRILVNIAFIGINSLALGMTGSRAGLISLIVVLVCMAFLNNKKYSIRNMITRLFFTSGILAFLYLLATVLPDAAYGRLFVDDYSVGGWSNRDLLWNKGIDLFIQKPIFGWGWGYVEGLHNTLLTILVDVGLFGTLIFVVFLAKIIFEGMRAKKPLAVMLLVAGLIPSLSIDAINKRFFWNGIIVSVMLLNAYKNESKDEEKR